MYRNTILSSVHRSLKSAKMAVHGGPARRPWLLLQIFNQTNGTICVDFVCRCAELENFAQNYSYDPRGKHPNEKGGLEWINAVLAGQHTEQNLVLESVPTKTVSELR